MTDGSIVVFKDLVARHARLSDLFGAIPHFGHTRGLKPVERTAEWNSTKAPAPLPSGI
jgi:hypothetical protein